MKYLFATATVYEGRSNRQTDGWGTHIYPLQSAEYPSSYGILIL